MLTGRNGGWPLTMFLRARPAAFLRRDLLPERVALWDAGVSRILLEARQGVLRPASQRRHASRARSFRPRSRHLPWRRRLKRDRGALAGAPRSRARDHLDHSFDVRHGGFGGAPKFPHPDSIELLLRRYAAKGDARALEMATLTLRRMAEGGIYDQVGGGFARYSVDERFRAIPHFEKMLYDNGWLLCALRRRAWTLTREPLFARICECGDLCMGDPRDAIARRAATTRRSTRTPKARKASTTCGAWTRLARSSMRRNSPAASRTFGASIEPPIPLWATPGIRASRRSRSTIRKPIRERAMSSIRARAKLFEARSLARCGRGQRREGSRLAGTR